MTRPLSCVANNHNILEQLLQKFVPMRKNCEVGAEPDLSDGGLEWRLWINFKWMVSISLSWHQQQLYPLTTDERERQKIEREEEGEKLTH